MILKFPSATQPLNKITFKPAFLKELNRYHQFHVTFIPALYISEEQAARYRSRWQISDPADSLGAVINKATLLVKVIDKRGNVRYFDEGGICPPPDNCKFPSIPR